MYFAVICRDKPDSLELRMENRPKHLAYVEETGTVFVGGPFLEEGKMVGSLIILDVADRAAAESWAANDPYAKAGLFSDVQVREWKKVFG